MLKPPVLTLTMMHVLPIAFLAMLAITAKANGEDGYRGDSVLTVSCYLRIKFWLNITNARCQAELAFRSIFSLAFLVLAGLCVIVLVTRPGRAPKVYFTLFFAALFRAISTIVTVFNIVIFADGITESPSSMVHTIVAFTVLVNYFCFWSFALFFLSTCLLVRDRQLSFLKASNSNTAPTAYYAFFALVMVFATVSATYYVVLQAKTYLDSGFPFEEGVRMENISMDLAYTFESLTYLASIFAAGYIIYAYQELRRPRSSDKVLLSHYNSENSNSSICL